MAGKRRGVLYLFLFVSLYVVAGFLFALAEREAGNNYYEVFRQKAKHAEQAETSRRILLVGGSNVNFGYRSKVIEDELKISTTNLALNREGGNPQVLRELVLNLVKEGDVVVYSSVSFWNEINLDPGPSADLLKAAGLNLSDDLWQDTQTALAWHWRPFPGKQPLLFELPRLYRRYLAQESSPHFSIYSESGDIKSCTPIQINPRAFASPPQSGFIESLKTFRERLKELGSEFVLEFSWLYIHEADREKWLSEYQPFFDALKQEFTLANQDLNIVLQSDQSIFCDTENHLSNESAVIRSQNMAHFLRQLLSQ